MTPHPHPEQSPRSDKPVEISSTETAGNQPPLSIADKLEAYFLSRGTKKGGSLTIGLPAARDSARKHDR